MDILLEDFKADLAKVQKLLKLIQSVRLFRAKTRPAKSTDEFVSHAVELHETAVECHADLVLLSGALVLYLGGRFEFYVRERFEQSCDAIAAKCTKFSDLPKPMRSQLISLTAAVMSEPRKYGHGDKGVESFIKNLAANLAATDGLTEINRQCLSITYENMRAATLKDLFDRIGAKDIWQGISEQACIRTYLAVADVAEAKNKAIKYLNDFMELRNQIAHPSGNFNWPDVTSVEEHIAFFNVLAGAISDVVALHEATVQISASQASSSSHQDSDSQAAKSNEAVSEGVTGTATVEVSEMPTEKVPAQESGLAGTELQQSDASDSNAPSR